ncbi:hypothetical protein ACK8HX_11130 [Oryzobacter sp. R7]|uniref:hypothetical protein n=1 Tax=Oryzobacter faecalis TaxID=3388656 RepID=UPI00398CAC4F
MDGTLLTTTTTRPAAADSNGGTDTAPTTRAARHAATPAGPRILGRLRRVTDVDEVWPTMAEDLPAWLSLNVDLLEDVVGGTLTVVGSDVLVGRVRVGLRATDAEGRAVLVVADFEGSDLERLGSALSCAAALDASAVVWLGRHLHPDVRRALDWLNERTDHTVRFFGVEVGLVRLGDDDAFAPVLDVAVRPDDAAMTAGPVGRSRAAVPESAENRVRQDLYAEILAAVALSRPAIEAPGRNHNSSWISFAEGPFGSWGLTQASDGRLRVEARLDCGDPGRNTSLLELMDATSSQWAVASGVDLEFERLPGRGACRIAAHHPAVDLLTASEAERMGVIVWAVRTVVAMHDAMDVTLRGRAALLADVRSFR